MHTESSQVDVSDLGIFPTVICPIPDCLSVPFLLCLTETSSFSATGSSLPYTCLLPLDFSTTLNMIQERRSNFLSNQFSSIFRLLKMSIQKLIWTYTSTYVNSMSILAKFARKGYNHLKSLFISFTKLDVQLGHLCYINSTNSSSPFVHFLITVAGY